MHMHKFICTYTTKFALCGFNYTSYYEELWFCIAEFNTLVDPSEDVVTLKVKTDVDGESEYILDDDASYSPCNLLTS